MKIKLFCILFIITLIATTGCQKAGKAEFYDFVLSHESLTNETNNAIIASIRADMASMPNMSDNDKMAAQSLIDRLEFIKKQSSLIVKYEEVTDVDQKVISDLIKNKWDKNKDNNNQ